MRRIEENVSSEPVYFLSKLWFNRFQFLCTPGPVSNFDFVCEHGGVNLIRNSRVIDMVVRVPSSVYSYFIDTYGSDGSPPLAEADYAVMGCITCEQKERLLSIRRKREQQDIAAIDTNSVNHGEYWYLISSVWLQSWHSFKMGGPQPSAINNMLFLREDGTPKRNMRRGFDYRGVNASVWRYFHSIYGGGPTVVRGLDSPPYLERLGNAEVKFSKLVYHKSGITRCNCFLLGVVTINSQR